MKPVVEEQNALSAKVPDRPVFVPKTVVVMPAPEPVDQPVVLDAAAVEMAMRHNFLGRNS
ncbi:MAG: hypothetical protein PW792_01860 [Acidobacteriaceae bacterium]|nr:hypothetical protein [Acidobacteriaceae bacterium]